MSGRPRSPEADQAILGTTLELLAEEGLRGLSIEHVAARSGVAKTTIYRRYPSKKELVAAALGTLAMSAPSGPETGEAEGDFLALVRARTAEATESKWNLLVPRLVIDATGEPELYAVVRRVLVDPERELVGGILRQGIERGDLPADLDVELATDVLIGVLVYRVLIDRGKLDAAESLAKGVFRLLRGGAAAGRARPPARTRPARRRGPGSRGPSSRTS